MPVPADIAVKDVDRDSLHTLPLSILPIRTPALRRARLIKNAELYAVVEVFVDQCAGSGQVEIEAVGRQFGLADGENADDLSLIRRLGLLPSYDIYSLRILLRQLGVEVRNQDSLRLSATKVRELSSYMGKFTRPLIQEIFADRDVTLQCFDDVIALFTNPDVGNARRKLQVMADRLGIPLTEIPKFLEDYGDIFLSLSYYRQCLDQIAPTIDQFLEALGEIRANHQLRNQSSLMASCDLIESTINELSAAISGRLENFERSTADMWRDISAERFRHIEKQIKGYQTTIGGILCALTVKVDAWARLFPTPHIGGPIKRSEFIMTSMRQGIGSIRRIEDTGPMLSASCYN